ncbi:MAG TPA: N-acetylglucosamine kinase, partial [Pseudoalteromonas sp.]|nr:N-acetylglucosamine kinase [Pseudoalteromonas sp.]
KFAPLVFSHSDDAFCQQLISEACAFIARYITYFEKQGIKKVSLMGGIASAITPYLPNASKARLTPALASAEQGAILMAREAI